MNIFTAAIRSPLFWLCLGGLCYYMALPPLNFGPLALAVPICWGIVIRQPASPHPNPHPNPHPLPKGEGTLVCTLSMGEGTVRWCWIYLTAFLFWLASIWWIACPHPLTSLGLLALSAYLSLYWLLFFVSARIAVHRFHIPLLAAMPVCWIGCEYLRCRMLGGFSFCALEHAFYQYPMLIQFASLGGSLLVGGVIMFIGAACLTRSYNSGRRQENTVFITTKAQRNTKTQNCKPLCSFVVKNILQTRQFVPVYGILALLLFPFSWIEPAIDYRYRHITAPNDNDAYSIVALQGNRQIHLNSTLDEHNENFRQFTGLTYQDINKRQQNGDALPDLIIFPETVCPIPVLAFEETIKPGDVYLPEENRSMTKEEATDWERWLRQFVQQIETPVIFGISTYVFKDNPDKPIRLNSALLVQPQQGDLPGGIYRYDKMHLVMFGEYIPFAEYLPNDFILKTLCPEAQRGSKPVAFPIGQGKEGKFLEASVNICFESSVAHLIRRQILTLRREGHDPQVLINMSNDGWFRFSPQIEQHLATHVFRAVENRMYYVTSTNGGFSAIISPYGTIEKIGKRGTAEAVAGLIVETLHESRDWTVYQRFGDWYALVCAIGVWGLAAFAFVATYASGRR